MKRKKKHFLFGFHKFNIYYLDFPDFYLDFPVFYLDFPDFFFILISRIFLFFIWILPRSYFELADIFKFCTEKK
jgi:hypothetical protein